MGGTYIICCFRPAHSCTWIILPFTCQLYANLSPRWQGLTWNPRSWSKSPTHDKINVSRPTPTWQVLTQHVAKSSLTIRIYQSTCCKILANNQNITYIQAQSRRPALQLYTVQRLPASSVTRSRVEGCSIGSCCWVVWRRTMPRHRWENSGDFSYFRWGVSGFFLILRWESVVFYLILSGESVGFFSFFFPLNCI